MSDTDPKTPNKTGASGAAWSEGEKIAYLIVLCENEGKIDAKIGNAPIPAGRSVISCKKLLVRLKEKHKDDIVKIKNGQAFAPAASTATDVSPEKPKAKPKATPKKRKSKLDLDAGAGNGGEDGKGDEGVTEGSPKKKAAPRGRPKKKVEAKEEVKEKEALVDKDVLEDRSE
ncbi:hypothetical protein J4E83_007909 [Alternaria metachromatica]|uniref:uncharacterized protein n=1 Tax=Alternaria metachromatica TaxID=283354 RepID=UPI0020C4680D|nr:uncharacterized protein J4E83_007909 [Alternaria metachromatica]XP_049241143.1 uncharacterized protein J4E84_008540 [Alternaria hordeiaustralica]KAI4611659.1 hypothetical protein J4E83_007909 [Alternaria metachromatica]KAI4678722.1 hypothetical protein J4E84_008540 [Alternaria hordeiaustralica]